MTVVENTKRVRSDEIEIDPVTLALWQSPSQGYHWSGRAIRLTVENVNRGAALLDRQKPGWEQSVIPTNLDMSQATLCIIGQTYGNYEYVGIPFGMQAWVEHLEEHGDDGFDSVYDNLSNEDMERVDEMASDHGFLVSDTSTAYQEGVTYPLLDRVWVYLLLTRHGRSDKPYLAIPNFT